MVGPGAVSALAVIACALVPQSAVPDAPIMVTSAGPPATTGAGPGAGTPLMLALLAINDGPPPTDYQREDWAHWLDPDHNGCDAREDALAQASDVAATVGAACRVSAGHWISAYDGLETSDAGTFDVDHVVPLGNAYVSGGNTWPAERRAGYANDQADLWVVSASSNRSKGDRPPSQWRPPRAEVWCLYATRWTQIKLRWNLTATTPERDALGQMLATCAVPPSAG